MTEPELEGLLGKRSIVRLSVDGAKDSRMARVFRAREGGYRIVSATQPKVEVSAAEILSVTPITIRPRIPVE